ncbi:MAG: transposase [Candidatus Bipolaricaulota bacterium]|nr:transposase [Candidatus Bipolaricaulota bacterium]
MRSIPDRQRHHRRSIRLQGYDYSRSGAYYVTLCTQDRACLFGEVVDSDMHLNDAGRLVSDAWRALPDRFPTIDLDAFVIMPNHIHGVVVIAVDNNLVGAGLVPAFDVAPAQNAAPARDRATTRVAPTLGDVIGAYKSMVTVQYAHAVNTRGWPPFRKRLWQRNYYEHVIRNADSLNRIRQYILDNPRRWDEDRYNPNVQEGDE